MQETEIIAAIIACKCERTPGFQGRGGYRLALCLSDAFRMNFPHHVTLFYLLSYRWILIITGCEVYMCEYGAGVCMFS